MGKFWLASWIDSLYLPDEPTGDVEIVRGLGPGHARLFEDDLRRNGVDARACYWHEVGGDAIRAPERLPGIVGEHDRYELICGRVVTSVVVHGDDEPKDTWRWQASRNHQHPCLERAEQLSGEAALVEEWKADLGTIFPDRFFIIDRQPGEGVSFYEPDGDAPTDSETDWSLLYAGRRKGLVQAYRDKRAAGWVGEKFAEYLHPDCSCGCGETTGEEDVLEEHGVILATCRQCGKKRFVASRRLCYPVGKPKA